MNVPTMAKVVFSGAFALLCGLTAFDASAYTREVCGQAGIVKHPATEAGDWSNSYCVMTQNNSSYTRELDFPLQVDSSATVYVTYSVYGSGWGLGGGSQVEAQLLTMYQSGAYYTSSTQNPIYSTVEIQTDGMNASMPSEGSAFVAFFAQYGASINSVIWQQ